MVYFKIKNSLEHLMKQSSHFVILVKQMCYVMTSR